MTEPKGLPDKVVVETIKEKGKVQIRSEDEVVEIDEEVLIVKRPNTATK